MPNVLDELRDLIADNRGLVLAKVNADTKFSDIGFDSIDKVEMIMSVEEKFGVTLDNDIAVETVGELAKIVEGKQK